jgi:hypothetical protein
MRQMGPTGAEPMLARFANAKSMEPQSGNGADAASAKEEVLSLKEP